MASDSSSNPLIMAKVKALENNVVLQPRRPNGSGLTSCYLKREVFVAVC